jgi:hypothetical protein
MLERHVANRPQDYLHAKLGKVCGPAGAAEAALSSASHAAACMTSRADLPCAPAQVYAESGDTKRALVPAPRRPLLCSAATASLPDGARRTTSTRR